MFVHCRWAQEDTDHICNQQMCMCSQSTGLQDNMADWHMGSVLQRVKYVHIYNHHILCTIHFRGKKTCKSLLFAPGRSLGLKELRLTSLFEVIPWLSSSISTTVFSRLKKFQINKMSIIISHIDMKSHNYDIKGKFLTSYDCICHHLDFYVIIMTFDLIISKFLVKAVLS